MVWRVGATIQELLQLPRNLSQSPRRRRCRRTRSSSRTRRSSRKKAPTTAESSEARSEASRLEGKAEERASEAGGTKTANAAKASVLRSRRPQSRTRRKEPVRSDLCQRHFQASRHSGGGRRSSSRRQPDGHGRRSPRNGGTLHLVRQGEDARAAFRPTVDATRLATDDVAIEVSTPTTVARKARSSIRPGHDAPVAQTPLPMEETRRPRPCGLLQPPIRPLRPGERRGAPACRRSSLDRRCGRQPAWLEDDSEPARRQPSSIGQFGSRRKDVTTRFPGDGMGGAVDSIQAFKAQMKERERSREAARGEPEPVERAPLESHNESLGAERHSSHEYPFGSMLPRNNLSSTPSAPK